MATQPDTVTVFVKTSGAAKYQAELIDSPARLVVDFEDTTYGWRKTPLAVSSGPLKQIRGSQYRKGVARVVVELTRPVGYAIREDDDGLTIVIPTNMPPLASTVNVPTPKAAVGTPVPETARPTVTPEPAPARVPMTATPAPNVRIAQAPATPPSTATPTTPPPSTAPAPAVTASQVPETQRLISLDFKDADVVNLLRILAAESSKNIVIGDDVKGKMSITLRNVPWQLALDTIMEARGLVKTERENVIRIVSAEQLAKERDAATRLEDAKRKASSETRLKEAETALKEQEAIDKKRAAELANEDLIRRGPLTEETIRLSYGDPDDIARTLQGILGIPPDGIQSQTPILPSSAVPGQGPIPAPPFSQLFGPGQPVPLAPPSPSSDVLAKGITIRAHRPTNSIFIRHYQADLARIKKLIEEKLDIPLPQVKIEARMEILSRDDLFAFGIQFGGGGVATSNTATLVGRGFTSNQSTAVGIAPSGLGSSGVTNPNLTLGTALPVSATTGLPAGGNVINLPIGALLAGAAGAGTGGLAFGIIGSRLNLNLALEALRTEGKTRTLARPEVVTVENNKASISLGEEIPYATISSAGTQIQFKEALLKLEVTPTVVREIDHNRIKMKVLVENNSRGTTTIDLGSAGAPPVIVRRKAETEVLIREGERLVIGGVTNNEATEQTRKVPLFGDVPLLGWLFKQTGEQNRATELVVFITPTIIRRDISARLPATTTPR